MIELLTAATDGLPWTPDLVRLLLEELYVDDEIDSWVAGAGQFDADAVPQIVAVAIALRHSWRVDDFVETVRRLGLATQDAHRSD